MTKIKEIKCSETEIVRGSSCDAVFEVSSVINLKEVMQHHYLNVKPHTSESQNMFDSSIIGNIENGMTERAKKLFDNDKYGKVIKNS